MNGSAPTEGLPEPTLDAYTPMQLVKIINNGAQVSQTHPQYAQVRQIMTEALSQLSIQHHTQNAMDSLAALPQPGPVGAGIVNFGQGASLGLLGQNSPIPFLQGAIDPTYLSQARSQQPLASAGGEIGGLAAISRLASPLVAGLGPAMGGALLGGGFGATQGAVESKPGERGTGALVGGALGTVGGAVGGKAANIVGRIWGNAMRLLGRGAGPTAVRAVTEAAERDLGEPLSADARQAFRDFDKGKISGEDLQTALDFARGGAAAIRVQSGGVSTELPPSLSGKISPIAGTEGRGFEVTGPRTTPAPPTAPTVAEVQDRLGQARAAFGGHTAESILPQPSGGVSLTPRAAADVSAAKPTAPEPFAATRQIAGAVNQLQEKMGRALTPQEREKVLELLLGPRGARPGHPLWFGGGSPTPRGPILPE